MGSVWKLLSWVAWHCWTQVFVSLHKGTSKSHCGHGACSEHLLWDSAFGCGAPLLKASSNNGLPPPPHTHTHTRTYIMLQGTLFYRTRMVLQLINRTSWWWGNWPTVQSSPSIWPVCQRHWAGGSPGPVRAPSTTMYSHRVIPPVNLFKLG